MQLPLGQRRRESGKEEMGGTKGEESQDERERVGGGEGGEGGGGERGEECNARREKEVIARGEMWVSE